MKQRMKRAFSMVLVLVLALTSMTFSKETSVTAYAENGLEEGDYILSVDVSDNISDGENIFYEQPELPPIGFYTSTEASEESLIQKDYTYDVGDVIYLLLSSGSSFRSIPVLAQSDYYSFKQLKGTDIIQITFTKACESDFDIQADCWENGTKEFHNSITCHYHEKLRAGDLVVGTCDVTGDEDNEIYLSNYSTAARKLTILSHQDNGWYNHEKLWFGYCNTDGNTDIEELEDFVTGEDPYGLMNGVKLYYQENASSAKQEINLSGDYVEIFDTFEDGKYAQFEFQKLGIYTFHVINPDNSKDVRDVVVEVVENPDIPDLYDSNDNYILRNYTYDPKAEESFTFVLSDGQAAVDDLYIEVEDSRNEDINYVGSWSLTDASGNELTSEEDLDKARSITIQLSKEAHGNFWLYFASGEVDNWYILEYYFKDSSDPTAENEAKKNKLSDQYPYVGTLITEEEYAYACEDGHYGRNHYENMSLRSLTYEGGNSILEVMQKLSADVEKGLDNTDVVYIECYEEATDSGMSTQYISDEYGYFDKVLLCAPEEYIPNLCIDGTVEEVNVQGATYGSGNTSIGIPEETIIRYGITTFTGEMHGNFVDYKATRYSKLDGYSYEIKTDSPIAVKEVSSLSSLLTGENKEKAENGEIVSIGSSYREIYPSKEAAAIESILDEDYESYNYHIYSGSITYRVGFSGEYQSVPNGEYSMCISNSAITSSSKVYQYLDGTWVLKESTIDGQKVIFTGSSSGVYCLVNGEVSGEVSGSVTDITFNLIESKSGYYQDADLSEIVKLTSITLDGSVWYEDDIADMGIDIEDYGYSWALVDDNNTYDISDDVVITKDEDGKYPVGNYCVMVADTDTGHPISVWGMQEITIVPTYQISYVIEGGSFITDNLAGNLQTEFSPEIEKKVHLPYGGELLQAEGDGCTLDGWYKEADYSGERIPNNSLDVSGAEADIILYGKITRDTLTISYSADGKAKAKKTEEVGLGKETQLPTDLFTNSSRFKGWAFTDASGNDISFNDPNADEGEEAKNITVDFRKVEEVGELVKYQYGSSADQTFFLKKGEKSITLKPVWDGNTTYNLTLVYDAESYMDEDCEDYEYSFDTLTYNTYSPCKAYTLPTAKTITYDNYGYTFDGWYTNPEYTGKKVTTIAKKTKGDKIFYAKWKLNKYTVKFNANGGSGKMASMTMDVVTKTYAPVCKYTKVGYKFAGWKEKYSGEVYEVGELLDTYSMILYPLWVPTTYRVTYDLCEGSGSSSVYLTFTYNKKSGKKLDYEPEREGYTFKGWYTSSSYTKKITTTAGLTKNTTVYAKWVPDYYTTYTISGNEGGLYMTGKIAKSVKLKAMTLTKADEKFMGWDTDPSADTVVFADKATIPAYSRYVVWDEANGEYVLNLYPVWRKNFNVYYVTGGGTLNAQAKRSYSYGTGITADQMATASRNGYEFAGWYTNSKFSGKKVTTITGTQSGNITLYAKWTAKKYTVTFNSNLPEGTTCKKKMKDESMVYGTAKALTKCAFTAKGYQFAGWSTDPYASYYQVEATNGQKVAKLGTYQSQVTLYAVWKPIKYTITYVLYDEHGNKKTETTYYTVVSDYLFDNVNTRANSNYYISRELGVYSYGYSFTGWCTDAKYKKPVTNILKGTKTGNITVYGKLTLVK